MGFKRPNVAELRAEAFAGGERERARVLDIARSEQDRLFVHIERQPIVDANAVDSQRTNPEALVDQGLEKAYRYIGVVEAETPNSARFVESIKKSRFIQPWLTEEVGHGEMYRYKTEAIDDVPIEVPEFSLSKTQATLLSVMLKSEVLHGAAGYAVPLIGRFNERCNVVMQSLVRQRELASGHEVFARATGEAVRQELWHSDYYDLDALIDELTLHPVQLLLGREIAMWDFTLVGAHTPERKSLCHEMIDDITAGDMSSILSRIDDAIEDLVSGHQQLVSDGPLTGVAKFAMRRLGREKSYEQSVYHALGVASDIAAA